MGLLGIKSALSLATALGLAAGAIVLARQARPSTRVGHGNRRRRRSH